MLIKKVTLYKLDLKLGQPFITGFGTIDHKQTVIVEVEDESGRKGYGEASSLHAPIYNDESVDICMLVLENYLAPLVLGKEATTVAELTAPFSHIVGNNIAKASLEFALWDLYSQLTTKSLAELFSVQKNTVEIGANSIGIQATHNDVIEKIKIELEQGFKRIKLKIKPAWDIELLTKVRDEFPKVEIMVDLG